MAEQAQDRADSPEEMAQWVQDRQLALMWILLGVGVLLVLCSNAIGQAAVEQCSSPGNCSWNAEDARQVALNWRWLGGMLFAAGLVERLVLCLRGLGRSAV